METTSFAKIVERRLRKVLKAEGEHGEFQLRAWQAIGENSRHNDTIITVILSKFMAHLS